MKYETCPNCGEETLAVIRVEKTHLNFRCFNKECGWKTREEKPKSNRGFVDRLLGR